jgi:hypothetical protein
VADRGASAAGGDAGDRILGFGSLDNFGPYLTAFRKGLNEAGFVERSERREQSLLNDCASWRWQTSPHIAFDR